MLYTIGSPSILENIVVLSATKNFSANFSNYRDLEYALHDFLKEQQPSVPRLNRLGSNLIKDDDMEQQLAGLFSIESELDDKNQSNMIGERFSFKEQKEIENKYIEVMNYMKSIHPEAKHIFDLTIDSVFLRKSENSGGGSTSNAIGVIWLNSRKHWSNNDLIELFIHELTHNLMFIDELRYLHYNDYDLILDPKNYTQSAILHTKRPLDKVIHSIVVATEIFSLRKHILGEPNKPCVHPPSNTIKKQAVSAYQNLINMPNFLELTTSRTRFLMDRCYQLLQNSSLGKI